MLMDDSGGQHFAERWKRNGHCQLACAVQQLGMQTEKPVKMDYVVSTPHFLLIHMPNECLSLIRACTRCKTSSVGALKTDFLRSLYLAAQGVFSILQTASCERYKEEVCFSRLAQAITGSPNSRYAIPAQSCQSGVDQGLTPR